MERRTDRSATTPGRWRAGRPGPDGTTGDRHWRLDARCAGWCALGFAVLTLLLDWGSGGLTVARADLWAVLGVLVFAVLRPPRVSAGDGWLAVRGLVCSRRVCTDALVAVRLDGSIATRLVLRDTDGHSVAFDPKSSWPIRCCGTSWTPEPAAPVSAAPCGTGRTRCGSWASVSTVSRPGMCSGPPGWSSRQGGVKLSASRARETSRSTSRRPGRRFAEG
ncbi:hypothetical protein SAZ11_57285 [Streptomyces sp. FXJ1.4098]|nr:hypothetical protein [Streptomyces sp. FXJ1.4098]